jgi:fucose permease
VCIKLVTPGLCVGGPPRGADGSAFVPHYHVEIVISLMVFFFIGGKVTSTAYLVTYIADTLVVPVKDESSVVLVLWIAITVGRLAGVWDQRFLTNKTLPIHLSIFCVGGTISMLLVLLFLDNSDCFWVGVAFYGLFNGPCVGYCYDLNNRITYPTEKSMSIVMFGLNFGASLVPYATTMVWTHGGSIRHSCSTCFDVMCFLGGRWSDDFDMGDHVIYVDSVTAVAYHEMPQL